MRRTRGDARHLPLAGDVAPGRVHGHLVLHVEAEPVVDLKGQSEAVRGVIQAGEGSGRLGRPDPGRAGLGPALVLECQVKCRLLVSLGTGRTKDRA